MRTFLDHPCLRPPWKTYMFLQNVKMVSETWGLYLSMEGYFTKKKKKPCQKHICQFFLLSAIFLIIRWNYKALGGVCSRLEKSFRTRTPWKATVHKVIQLPSFIAWRNTMWFLNYWRAKKINFFLRNKFLIKGLFREFVWWRKKQKDWGALLLK